MPAGWEDGRDGKGQKMSFVTLSAIEAAAERIHGVARVTPLLEVAAPGDGVPLRVKCENLQAAGAFKIRGAYNFVSQLPKTARQRGIITYSSGNHAQAVALAARTLGVSATVVMPTTAPQIKIDGARELGAEVLFEGTTSNERRRRAESEAAARVLTMVPPFDDARIIAGQGTVGREILAQCPDVSAVFVPVGGGGLRRRRLGGDQAGTAGRPHRRRRAGRGPDNAEVARGGGADHARAGVEHRRWLAAGAPGDLNFAHVRRFVDEIVTVDDRAIARAVLWLHRRAKLVVEPSGAAAVAAVQAAADRSARPVVAILSGGNMAPETLARCAELAG